MNLFKSNIVKENTSIKKIKIFNNKNDTFVSKTDFVNSLSKKIIKKIIIIEKNNDSFIYNLLNEFKCNNNKEKNRFFIKNFKVNIKKDNQFNILFSLYNKENNIYLYDVFIELFVSIHNIEKYNIMNKNNDIFYVFNSYLNNEYNNLKRINDDYFFNC